MLDELYKLTRIIILYIIILVLYYQFKDTYTRTTLTTILFIICVFVFKINYKSALLYLFLATCAVFTEYIFIRFFSNSWDYRKPDQLLVPYWLIPLWSVAIIIIIKLYQIFKMIT